MIVTGYTNEYNEVIPAEKAKDYIWKKIKGNEDDKQWFIDYAWDVLMENPTENEKLKEAYFNGVCKVVECDEQGIARG